MIDVIGLIEIEAKARGIKNYNVRLVSVDITSPYQQIVLDKYLYLFISTRVDTPALPTKIELRSPDNLFQFTKTTLENTDMAQLQFFSEELIIKTENYGSNDPADFIPFTLEFLKIIPGIMDN